MCFFDKCSILILAFLGWCPGIKANYLTDSAALNSYTESVAAKMLLSCKPLATHGTGKGSLSCVTTDVPLHDPLLLGSVWAEWALMEFYWHY